MSFSKEKRTTIKRYMLEKISSNEKSYVSKTVDTFGITRNTVYRYLRELENENIIVKTGKHFHLKSESHIVTINLTEQKSLSEDIIYIKYIEPYINDLPENVQDMWAYCFTEMMNNVIDHSMATEAIIFLSRDFMNTSLIIQDNGVGIFNKIKTYYHFSSLDDAVTELFKGKLTTDEETHSGEGIFFTSRISDTFAAVSDNKIFSHNKYSEVLEDLDNFPDFKNLYEAIGTLIFIRISNFSQKTSSEIMDQYADIDGGFIRTSIPLKNIYERYPVSRSQAKRLTLRFESFREIVLDFANIPLVGQGFAHELFVNFKKKHPDVVLIPINTNEDVSRMITHVMESNKQ